MGIVGQVVKLLERGDMTKIEKLLLFNTSNLSATGLNCFFASNFECRFKPSLRYLNLSGGSIAQSYNDGKAGFQVNDEKQILKEIIYYLNIKMIYKHSS